MMTPKLFSFVLTFLFCSSAFAADPAPQNPSCQNPSEVVNLPKKSADAWATNVMPLMSGGKLCSNNLKGKILGSCVITDIAQSKDNPYLGLKIQEGDRIYGSESARVEGDFTSAMKILVSIFSGKASCLKIETSAGALKVIKYGIAD